MADLKSPEVVRVDPVRASVNMGFKRNMGNYESLNINIGISASANADEKAVDVIERVYKLVETKLLEKFEETEEALRGEGLGEKG